VPDALHDSVWRSLRVPLERWRVFFIGTIHKGVGITLPERTHNARVGANSLVAVIRHRF